jgi:hypothetical protein
MDVFIPFPQKAAFLICGIEERKERRWEAMLAHRMLPLQAAQQLLSRYFPDCEGAILAGSVVRGEATATSDLDMVIFQSSLASAYRESLVEYTWPMELFVHSFTSYKDYFQSDIQRARPSLVRMVAEGIIVRDAGRMESIK